MNPMKHERLTSGAECHPFRVTVLENSDSESFARHASALLSDGFVSSLSWRHERCLLRSASTGRSRLSRCIHCMGWRGVRWSRQSPCLRRHGRYWSVGRGQLARSRRGVCSIECARASNPRKRGSPFLRADVLDENRFALQVLARFGPARTSLAAGSYTTVIDLGIGSTLRRRPPRMTGRAHSHPSNCARQCSARQAQ